MMIGLSLWCVARLRPILSLFGLRTDHVLAVLEARLTLDFRGHPLTGRPTSAEIGPVLVVLAFWLAGIGSGVLALLAVDPFLWAAGTQTLYLFLFGVIVLLQYGNVLVDPTDIAVLAARPVAERTLFAARLIHVLVYGCVLGAAHAFFPVMLGCIGYRSVMPLLLVPIGLALTSVTAVGAIGLLYAGTLRLFGPRSFQRATFWIQIGTMALLLGGAQVGQHLVPWSRLYDAVKSGSPWLLAPPPAHVGGLSAASMGEGFGPWGVHALLAFAVPPLLLALALRFASRDFALGLQGAIGGAAGREASWPDGPFRRLGARLLSGPDERCGYDFAFGMAGRDRLFVRMAWVQVIALFVPLIGGAFSMTRAGLEGFDALAVLVCHMAGMGFLMAAESMRITENEEAAWILEALPMGDRRRFAAGALIAVLWRILVPMFALLVLFQLTVFGWGVLPDLVLALASGCLVGLGLLPTMQVGLPFTHRPSAGETDVRNLPSVFGVLALCGATAAAHGLLLAFAPVWVRAVLALALLPFVRRALPRVRALRFRA